MKKYLPLIFLLLALLVGYLFFNYPSKKMLPEFSRTQEPQIVDYTANFEIYTLGTKRVFTASMYHNLSPDIYLESPDPGVVHIKKAGLTWADLFATLPMELTKDCLTTGTGQVFCSGNNGTLSFFINDTPDPNALSREIKTGDRLLVTYE